MNSSLSSLFLLCAILAAAAANARDMIDSNNKCRTRFTFTRPSNENASSILFGVSTKSNQQPNKHYDSSNISFNHDEVGITKPDTSNHEQRLFPMCRGFAKKMKEDLGLNEGCSVTAHDATNVFSSTTLDGWRMLIFRKRVGKGEECYRNVLNAVHGWNFESYKGEKSMGIVSAVKSKKAAGNSSNEAPWFTVPRRNLLAHSLRFAFRNHSNRCTLLVLFM